MYYYLIDPQQYDGRNFESLQTRLLSLIGEYQVAGETARVTSLRRVEDLVATALAHGCKTLVVVGGDKTLVEVMPFCKNKDITIAFVPLDSQSEVARIIGVTDLDQAVSTVAKRRVVKMDLAKINDKLFISSVNFGFLEKQARSQRSISWRALGASRPQMMEISIDGNYRMKDAFFAGSIINSRDVSLCPTGYDKSIGSPQDGILDLVLVSNTSKYTIWKNRKLLSGRCFEVLQGSTVVRAKKIKIDAPGEVKLFTSGLMIATTPVTIELAKEKLKMIVGRDRQF